MKKKLLPILVLALLTIKCSSNNSNQNMKDLEKTIRDGENIYIENKTFNQAIDFTKLAQATLVNKGLKTVRIISSITFSNCTFNEEVIAFSIDESDIRTTTLFQSNLSFIGCTFNAPVNFRGISVSGMVVYSGSFFENTSNFEEASFQQLAFFNNASFHKELRFQNAFFMQRANFINVQFDENASFQGATFNSTAQFSNTRFYGYADFSLVKWKEDVFFNYAELADRSTFSSSRFWGFADFLTVTFGTAEMMNCEFFGKLSLNGSTIAKQLMFQNNYFLIEEPDLEFLEKEKLKID